MEALCAQSLRPACTRPCHQHPFPPPPPPTPISPLQLIEGVALVASALPDGQRQACVQQMLDIVVQPMQGLLQAAAQGGSAPGTPTAGGGPAAPAARDAQLALVLPLMERVTTIFRVSALY